MANPFAAIPAVGDDLASHRKVLEALKQNVEVLLGVRGSTGTAGQLIVYRQKQGDPPPTGLNDGDQWWQPPVTTGDAWQLSIWWKGSWQRI
jgi:hypothetical protein